jgi:DNA adenine methylase
LRIIDGEGLGIKYSVANTHGNPETSRELVILNYDPLSVGGLF